MVPARNGSSGAGDHPDPVDYGLGPIDIVLGVLAAPLALLVLMFATSGTVGWLARPRSRRLVGLAVVILEAVAVAMLIAWLT